MFQMLQDWYRKKFTDPQIVVLLGILLIGFGIIYFFSHLLMPLLVAIVFAYLLEWPIRFLVIKLKLPRSLSVILVLGSFIAILSFLGVVLLPKLWNQAVTFIQDLPSMFNLLNAWLQGLPEHYPELVDYATLDSIVTNVKSKILGMGESLLTLSVNSIISLVGLGIYAF